MSRAGQQDKVPSPRPEEQSGTICQQPQAAGVWDGVTEHPSFKAPNTSKIRKLNLNHTLPPPSPAGHNLSPEGKAISGSPPGMTLVPPKKWPGSPQGELLLWPTSSGCSLPPLL